MFEIDPARTDLAEEFRRCPDGPYSPELTLVVNRLRMMPLEDRHVLVCTRRGQEWVLAKMPAARGGTVELVGDHVFSSHRDGAWEVFRRRWKTVTGRDLAP